MSVPEDVGCKNSQCIKTNECKRADIYKKGVAKDVKSFGGTPKKGCGKFLPLN